MRVNLPLVVGALETVVKDFETFDRERAALEATIVEYKGNMRADSELIGSLRTQIATYEAASRTQTDEGVMAYAARLSSALHARLAHPDYEYTHTEGQRKTVWNDVPPADDGMPWERNADYRDGFERFDYHEESYWRRLKPVEQPEVEMCELHPSQPEPCISCEAGGY
jgi:hypothetical protein